MLCGGGVQMDSTPSDVGLAASRQSGLGFKSDLGFNFFVASSVLDLQLGSKTSGSFKL